MSSAVLFEKCNLEFEIGGKRRGGKRKRGRKLGKERLRREDCMGETGLRGKKKKITGFEISSSWPLFLALCSSWARSSLGRHRRERGVQALVPCILVQGGRAVCRDSFV